MRYTDINIDKAGTEHDSYLGIFEAEDRKEALLKVHDAWKGKNYDYGIRLKELDQDDNCLWSLDIYYFLGDFVFHSPNKRR